MAFKEIGALWRKQDKNGNTFLGGKIEFNEEGRAYAIVVTKNKFKKTDKQPDFRVSIKVEDAPKVEEPPVEDDQIPF